MSASPSTERRIRLVVLPTRTLAEAQGAELSSFPGKLFILVKGACQVAGDAQSEQVAVVRYGPDLTNNPDAPFGSVIRLQQPALGTRLGALELVARLCEFPNL